ncbi:MAG TPA: PHP domain-containing protein [Chthonomonadaceae bacterium]|nr:PHP domain-containing protein [Chthonomonadaceae bacterium]
MHGIDLHAHTTASDGQHSPAELVRMAAEIGLAALAVTDHDTTAGLHEALAAGRACGVEVVPGIELSAEPPKGAQGGRGQCHILGLFVDPDNAALLDRLRNVIEQRNSRNARIIERMRSELHWDVTLEEVEAAAGGDVVARPHFARVLVEKGLVCSVKEAFDVYLGKGGKAYMDRDRLTAEEAVRLIHGAGGAASLAHPNNLRLAEPDADAYISSLKDLGMDAIEARYNLHTAADTARYLALARRLEMPTSGGSDFHGLAVKPAVRLGHVEGDRPAPAELLDGLRAALR